MLPVAAMPISATVVPILGATLSIALALEVPVNSLLKVLPTELTSPLEDVPVRLTTTADPAATVPTPVVECTFVRGLTISGDTVHTAPVAAIPVKDIAPPMLADTLPT